MTLTKEKKKLPENKQSGDLPPNQRQDICAGRQVCRHVDQSDVSRGGFREAAGGAERIKRARRRPWANSEEVRVCPREEDQLLHSTLKQTFLSEICGLSSLSTLTVSSGIFLFCVSFFLNIYLYIYLNIYSFIYFLVICILLYLKKSATFLARCANLNFFPLSHSLVCFHVYKCPFLFEDCEWLNFFFFFFWSFFTFFFCDLLFILLPLLF